MTKEILASAATTKTIEIPAEYTTITKTVEKTPASVKVIDIPAEYKTVTKTVLKKAAEVRTEDIPAEYKDITKPVLVKKGGYTTWQEVLCDSDTNTSSISDIQRALKNAGYDPGPVDGVMGGKTKDALSKYQRDKGLPEGNINMVTLKALGLK